MERPSISSWKLTVQCAECGAELVVEPDRHFVDCDHCHATSVVDLGGRATCFRLKRAHDDEQLAGHVKRWIRTLGLMQGVEETLVAGKELLVPFWTVRATEGERSLLAVDSADLPLHRSAQKPPGQLEHFGPDEAATIQGTFVEPSVPLPAARLRLGFASAQPEDQLAASLVYAPFVEFTYQYRGLTYEALADAATGKVYATARPRPFNRRLDQRLGLLLAGALLAYFGFAALLPGMLWPLVAYAVVSVLLWWGLTRVMAGSEPS